MPGTDLQLGLSLHFHLETPPEKVSMFFSNANQDLTPVYLMYRLLPSVQDFGSCGAVRRKKGRSGGFCWDSSISFLFHFPLLVGLESGLWGLLRPPAEVNVECQAAVVAAGKV